MPLSPLSPSVAPFLVIVSDAGEEEWGLSLTISPARLKAVEERLRLALSALDSPLVLRHSPLQPATLWLLPRTKCRGEPGADGSVLFPPLPSTARSAP